MVAWQEQPSGLRCLGEPGLKFFNFPCAALPFLVRILSLYSPRWGARWSYKRTVTGAPQKPKRQVLLKYMPPKQTEWHLFKSSALILFLTEMSWLFSILSAHLMLPTFGQVSAAAFWKLLFKRVNFASSALGFLFQILVMSGGCKG